MDLKKEILAVAAAFESVNQEIWSPHTIKFYEGDSLDNKDMVTTFVKPSLMEARQLVAVIQSEWPNISAAIKPA